jgi:hypothetical protein
VDTPDWSAEIMAYLRGHYEPQDELKEKRLKQRVLTQNVHLAPNTQQAEQAGFTRVKNHKTCQSIFPEN